MAWRFQNSTSLLVLLPKKTIGLEIWMSTVSYFCFFLLFFSLHTSHSYFLIYSFARKLPYYMPSSDFSEVRSSLVQFFASVTLYVFIQCLLWRTSLMSCWKCANNCSLIHSDTIAYTQTLDVDMNLSLGCAVTQQL